MVAIFKCNKHLTAQERYTRPNGLPGGQQSIMHILQPATKIFLMAPQFQHKRRHSSF